MQESRLFKIIYYLLNHKQATANELAEKFEVSVRTIYRDIDVISSAGIPIYTLTGRHGGISLMDHFVLNKSLLTTSQQERILLALNQLAVLPNASEDDIISKLKALFQIDAPQWIDIDYTLWGEDNCLKDKFKLLETMIITYHMIIFEYTNNNGEISQRKVKPVKLLYKSNAWYLQAYCLIKEDFRFFKISRMHHIKETLDTFEPLVIPITTNHYSQELITVELQFTPAIAYRVYDEFSLSCIFKQTDGSLLVKVGMPNTDWLIRYLLSFGKEVKIIAPFIIQEKYNNEVKSIYNNIF